jgi:hypothetical protein
LHDNRSLTDYRIFLIADMQALTRRHGQAPQAFVIVRIVARSLST